MFPLFETIRIVDGGPLHLEYHEARMAASRRALFGVHEPLDLRAAIAATLRRKPPGEVAGVVRCRVSYGESMGDITLEPYRARAVRTLALVDGTGIEYAHKFTDRSAIDRLKAAVDTDDVLIVRDGLVTDASHANVAFHDGDGWITPSSPLLPGTTRARLIDAGRLRPAEVHAGNLGNFTAVVLMNAMIGFDDAHPVATGSITNR